MNSFIEKKELTGDAGLRRYFRLFYANGETKILMDCKAEPKIAENFINATNYLKSKNLPVPIIYKAENSLILLEDLGEKTIEGVVEKMPQILNLLSDWQQKLTTPPPFFKTHDFALLREELSRFELWFVPYVLGREFSKLEKELFDKDCLTIIKNIENQPKVVIHRDFHSRNLMQRKNGELVLIDYQDGLWGYAPYDLVSITRDCYLDHSEHYLTWEENFRKANYPQISSKNWQLACNYASLQRHLKVLGLFVRLAKQENKTRYLNDLPLVKKYALKETEDLKQELPFVWEVLN